jgi:hypothetical protein
LDPQFKKPLIIICILALLLCAYSGFAQSKDNKNKTTSRPVPQQPQLPPQLMPPHPPDKMGQRYFDIDAKRQIENIDGEDALPRSREFKRIDSTYYVGWMKGYINLTMPQIFLALRMQRSLLSVRWA